MSASELTSATACAECGEEYSPPGEYVDICPQCRAKESTDVPRWRYANLGCGEDHRNGWHNVDVRPECDPDEVVDFDSHPWPWPDGSFTRVLMDNVIEHLDDRNAALHELARVIEPGGTVTLRFPHWNSLGHYTNPSHTKTLTRNSLNSPPVDDFFAVESVDCTRVRFGRGLPKGVALLLSDHIGHVVSEVEVKARVVV